MRLIVKVEEMDINLEQVGEKILISKEIHVTPSIFSWVKFKEDADSLIEGWHSLNYSEEEITVTLIQTGELSKDYTEYLIEDIISIVKKNFEDAKEDREQNSQYPNYFVHQGGGGFDLDLEKTLKEKNIKVVHRCHQSDEVGASGGFFTLDLLIEAFEFIKLIKDLYDIGIILIPYKLKPRQDTMTIPNYHFALENICEAEKISPASLKLDSSKNTQEVDCFVFEQTITKEKYIIEVKDGEVVTYKKN